MRRTHGHGSYREVTHLDIQELLPGHRSRHLSPREAADTIIRSWLAILIALRKGNAEADQRGAFADTKQHTPRTVLVWALASGFAAYALWRLSEAVFGTAAEGKKMGLKSAP